MEEFVPPAFKADSFNCPLCKAYSHQLWHVCGFYESGCTSIPSLYIAFCSKCNKYSIWHEKKMVFPTLSNAPMPNPDLFDDVKSDYLEARNILSDSPRGAAAILRLSIEKLCKKLGDPSLSLDENIGKLVKEKGLSPRIQKALDSVRVIGNNAVHPGRIDLNDNPKTANTLFQLVNVIAQQLITDEKEVDDLFDKSLSDGEKNHIKKRDS